MTFATPKGQRQLAQVVEWLRLDYHMPAARIAEQLGIHRNRARDYAHAARARINEEKRKNPHALPERRATPRAAGPASYPVPVFLSLR